jgi:gliding motility-associated-like protein
LLEITGFFFYIFVPLKIIMKKIKIVLIAFGVLLGLSSKAQCGYDTTAVDISHILCNGYSTGAIDLFVQSDSDKDFSWVGPNGFTATSLDINSLEAGLHTLTISLYSTPHDINSPLICQLPHDFIVYETLPIEASFIISDICNSTDSADLTFTAFGGTPFISGELYNYQLTDDFGAVVTTNDTALNLTVGNYYLNITDENGCTSLPQDTFVPSVIQINPFMSSVGAICKDDNSGEARVFVNQGTGTPPFTFDWDLESMEEETDFTPIDSFSVIKGLFPGVYYVNITDAMGCVVRDSVEVKSNPNICISPYRAFSPNGDDTNEYWEIENIGLYPEAVISIYDRNGSQIFRRRNYQNAELEAFNGENENGYPLPSGTYYFIIDLENGDDVFKGTLTIVR